MGAVDKMKAAAKALKAKCPRQANGKRPDTAECKNMLTKVLADISKSEKKGTLSALKGLANGATTGDKRLSNEEIEQKVLKTMRTVFPSLWVTGGSASVTVGMGGISFGLEEVIDFQTQEIGYFKTVGMDVDVASLVTQSVKPKDAVEGTKEKLVANKVFIAKMFTKTGAALVTNKPQIESSWVRFEGLPDKNYHAGTTVSQWTTNGKGRIKKSCVSSKNNACTTIDVIIENNIFASGTEIEIGSEGSSEKVTPTATQLYDENDKAIPEQTAAPLVGTAEANSAMFNAPMEAGMVAAGAISNLEVGLGVYQGVGWKGNNQVSATDLVQSYKGDGTTIGVSVGLQPLDAIPFLSFSAGVDLAIQSDYSCTPLEYIRFLGHENKEAVLEDPSCTDFNYNYKGITEGLRFGGTKVATLGISASLGAASDPAQADAPVGINLGLGRTAPLRNYIKSYGAKPRSAFKT